MEAPLFEYLDYKKYLNDLSDSRPRGFRKSLAEAAHCQTAYISHVLNDSAHLSLEQATAIAASIGFSLAETRYWLLLVEYCRASTAALRSILSEQLDEMRERQLVIKERIGVKESLSPEHQSTYYSTWQYAAVHVALTIPSLRSKEALTKALRLSPKRLTEILEFLLSVGLAQREGDRFQIGTTRIHLEKSSPLIPQHHANWRLQAMADTQNSTGAEESIHYSSVFTISADDMQKIRSSLTERISEWVGIIKDSKEEQVYSLGIDFFRVDRR